jgi:hypothetical protein
MKMCYSAFASNMYYQGWDIYGVMFESLRNKFRHFLSRRWFGVSVACGSVVRCIGCLRLGDRWEKRERCGFVNDD